MRKRRLFCLLALFFYTSCAFAAPEIPQPSGWVNDFANVIPQDYNQKLNALIQELEEKTSSEIGVVTVESIAPYDEIEFARMLFDNWKPGKKGKDNGVLVLVAIRERRWRIETGYGVESILPDGLCGEIGREFMVPYFKVGKYGEGLYYGVSEISKVIAGNSRVDLSNSAAARPKGINDTATKAILPFFLLGFFLLWNIPWPIFIGLPFTLLFAFGFGKSFSWIWVFPVLGYIGAMVIRYFMWKDIPAAKRKSFWWVIIFGLFAFGGNYKSNRWGGFDGSDGGFGGGSWGGGGGGGGFGGGGGGGGGGGAGGGF